jgi:tripartite-type tricarboxylate transporter receptor subunit TctC
MQLCSRAMLGLLLALAPLGAGRAQDGAPFYKGKTLRIVISTGVAGGYGEYARSLAAHMGRQLAGAPNIIVQSMPGAGGLLAGNFMYAQAPADGLTIGILNSTVPLAPLWGSPGARFNTLKFNWLAALARADGVCTLWHTAPAKTWTELLRNEITVGSIGAGSPMETYPALLNRLFGTKIRVIGGYKAGSDIDLAMERGEIDGRCGTHLTTYKSLHPGWMAERKIIVPVLVAEKRRADYPDTPTVLEFVKDEPTRQQLELVMITQNLDRPVLAPPGTPAERVKELRAALMATLADQAFLAEIEKKNLFVDPVPGDDMVKAFTKAFSFPESVIAAVRETMGVR